MRSLSSCFGLRPPLRRPTVCVELTPFEVSILISDLTDRALAASEDPDQQGYCDFLFARVAALREALK